MTISIEFLNGYLTKDPVKKMHEGRPSVFITVKVKDKLKGKKTTRYFNISLVGNLIDQTKNLKKGDFVSLKGGYTDCSIEYHKDIKTGKEEPIIQETLKYPQSIAKIEKDDFNVKKKENKAA